MSYQVLARKWRPGNFSQVAGQAHVLKSLINALDNQRLHHAYLFTGTRGVGKTTLARILAKCLNCEEGVSSQPCEKCDSCIEINEGRFIDLMEVDAASRTKVEDTRELLDNVQYLPARGRYKVYLIDEVHMLSNHSFNALLKTLEEPPPHVKFLFATTDPQKLPVTILSRCLQFNLKNLSPQLISEYLTGVLEKEKIESEEEALWQISAAASGSMRDALTLVDQAISYCQGNITAKGVIEMLGIPPQRQVYELLKGMASRSVASILSLIHEISDQTPDYGHTLDSLLSTLHRIAIAQVEPGAVDNSYGDGEQIKELASLLSAEDVQLYYQMGLKGREDLRLANEVRTAFEMLLIRMLVFSPNYVAPAQNEAAETKEPVATSDAKSNEDQAASPENVVATADSEVEKKKTLAAPSTTQDNKPEAIEPEPDANPEALHEHKKPALPDSTESADERVSDVLAKGKWIEIYPQLTISGIAANVLANSELVKWDDSNFHFVLDKTQSAVYSEDLLPKISQALSDFFDAKLSAHIEIGETKNETPSMLSQRLKLECHTKMVDEFEQDENVQELIKHFSGTLAKESIAPLKG
ncbi:MAG: DNA polymerase III subunit gamma/tau [SAR86 cluster bacterium]|uniref:DNA polymerase III subunit gamma/tau n=1 Tax=SAR86 cluster bacterium TaxID=2030880 RepID=A0A2A5AGP2_9GAMM|nr:MAG: DNA polymerase III subunit gamma/tau [SAR86 cluster bacterium]